MKPKFLLLLLISSPSIAGTLQEVEQTYQKTSTLTAEFTQSTFVPILEKTITRPGRLFYQKGGKLRIEYAGEEMTHYITDGKILWIRNPATDETQTLPLSEGELPKETLKFLTEMGNLSTYFKVTPRKKGYQLKPKKKTTYRSLDATFGKDHYVETLILHTLEGNTSTYRFFNRVPNQKLSPRLFKP